MSEGFFRGSNQFNATKEEGIANIHDQGILVMSYYFLIAIKQNSIIPFITQPKIMTQQKTVALVNKSQGIVFYVSLFLRQGAEPSTPTMCALG